MSNQKYTLDFNILKFGFWVTVFLAVLKLSNTINISILGVFLPLIVTVGIVLLVVFLIGLITIYLISVKGIDLPDNTESEPENENNS